MMNGTCMLCKSNNWDLFLDGDTFQLFRCQTCSFVKTKRIGFIEHNDDQYVDKDEPKRQFLEKKEIYADAAKVLLDILDASVPHKKNAKLLDVGCGLGWLLKDAKNRGYSAFGIDSSKTFINTGKRLLHVNSMISTLEAYKTDQKYDVITLCHVIEHVPYPDKFLKKLNSLLKTNGILLIACPNIDAVMFHAQTIYWYPLSPGQHLWQYSKQTLGKFVERNDFTIVKMKTTNFHHDSSNWNKRIPMSWYLEAAKILDRGDQIVCIAKKYS